MTEKTVQSLIDETTVVYRTARKRVVRATAALDELETELLHHQQTRFREITVSKMEDLTENLKCADLELRTAEAYADGIFDVREALFGVKAKIKE